MMFVLSPCVVGDRCVPTTEEMDGSPGWNRTNIHGFAIRSLTTRPPGFAISGRRHHGHALKPPSLRSHVMSPEIPFLPTAPARQALSLTYGRYFAEFLEEESLVPLRLLASSTCVGLRYDVRKLNLEVFLGRLFRTIVYTAMQTYARVRLLTLKSGTRIYQSTKA